MTTCPGSMSCTAVASSRQIKSTPLLMPLLLHRCVCVVCIVRTCARRCCSPAIVRPSPPDTHTHSRFHSRSRQYCGRAHSKGHEGEVRTSGRGWRCVPSTGNRGTRGRSTSSTQTLTLSLTWCSTRLKAHSKTCGWPNRVSCEPIYAGRRVGSGRWAVGGGTCLGARRSHVDL